jgi:hypothetical protein
MTSRNSGSGWFRLEGHFAVPCAADEYIQWMMWGDRRGVDVRRVAETRVGTLWVSTVFLGLDHNFGDAGDPVLFETKIFSEDAGGDDYYQTRCSTWAEAEEDHRVAVAIAERRVRAAAASVPPIFTGSVTPKV